jgi:tRNA G18 (ribose-2'-O)-methylase SpoU
VSLGAERSVEWEYNTNPEVTLKKLQKEHYQIIGLEQTDRSVDYKTVSAQHPLLFIIGNEVEGIPENILSYCDVVAEIPMSGVKESLNVSVAFGIGLSRILNR